MRLAQLLQATASNCSGDDQPMGVGLGHLGCFGNGGQIRNCTSDITCGTSKARAGFINGGKALQTAPWILSFNADNIFLGVQSSSYLWLGIHLHQQHAVEEVAQAQRLAAGTLPSPRCQSSTVLTPTPNAGAKQNTSLDIV